MLPATLFGLAFSGPYFAVCPAEPHEIAAYAAVNLSVLASCTYLAFGGLPAKKEAAGAAKLLPLLLLGVFPLNIFMQVRPLMTAKFLLFRNFGPWHIFFILLLVAATVAVYFLLRKKSGEERFVALFLLSLALFFQLAARFSFVRLNDYQTEDGKHLGLYNVVKRMEMFFQDRIMINIYSSEGCGFEVCMEIKLQNDVQVNGYGL